MKTVRGRHSGGQGKGGKGGYDDPAKKRKARNGAKEGRGSLGRGSDMAGMESGILVIL
jgi:hypothetical protein